MNDHRRAAENAENAQRRFVLDRFGSQCYFTDRSVSPALLKLMKKLLLVAVAVLFCSVSATAVEPTEEMVAMRDGVKLSTIIYLPEGSGPWPVVLIRTPYGKQSQTRSNSEWTKNGFAFVVQDVRGTFKSEGKYRPFVHDQADGYDTIEGLPKQ